MTRHFVITETHVFGPAVKRHFVAVQDNALENVRIFFRKDPRRNGLGRYHDEAGRRIFTWEHQSDFDVAPELNEVLPEARHESFAAFLAEVGYSWHRNAYTALAAAA